MNKMQKFRTMLIIATVVIVTLSCGVFKTATPSTPVISSMATTPEVPTHTETATSSEVSESQPADEKGEAVLSVAYIKGGNVWLWRGGEPAYPLTNTDNVTRLALSSDGKVVAFEHTIDDYHSELWAVNTDTSECRMLVSVEEFDNYEREKWLDDTKSLLPYHFDFIPNTHILAYNTYQTFEGPGMALFDDLRLVNTDTNEKLTLLSAGQGGEFVYSPDGSQIAIITPTTISLINSDGSNRREVLTYAMVSTYSEYSYYALPVWATDSSSLRVVIPPADPLGTPPQPSALWSIPIDGNGADQLGKIMAVPFGGTENAFSPDFSHIIYTSEASEPGQNHHELHLADPNGANNTILMSNQYIAFYGWAPDSQHFVILTGEPPTVQLGDSENNFHLLTEDASGVGNVTWVSANEFLFIKGGDGFWELRLGTLDGKSGVLDTIPGSPPPYDFVFR